MAVFRLSEDFAKTEPAGYYDRRRMDFDAGNSFWYRVEFDADENAERVVQLWSAWRALGHLSVRKHRPSYEGRGLSAIAYAYELGGAVAIHPETGEPEELAGDYPVSAVRAAAVLMKYCAEHGKLAS